MLNASRRLAPRVTRALLTCTLLLCADGAGAEMVFSHYRGVSLGDPVQLVVDRLGANLADVATVHLRPALIQRLTYRPRRFVSGLTLEPDALAEMVLTFHVGRLARIAVSYDRDRTAGLTDADLLTALSATYGTSMLTSTPPPAMPSAAVEAEPIGRWGDTDTLVVLRREAYSSRVGLTITAIESDRAMQAAVADSLRLDAREAPARDAARRDEAAKAASARADTIRQANKATFTP